MDNLFLDNLLYAYSELTGFIDNSVPNQGSFDRDGFEKRAPDYFYFLKNKKKTTLEIAKELKIDLTLCEFEIHLFMLLNPGSVPLRFLSNYFKKSFRDQKNIDALQYMKENIKDLTMDYVCERLKVSEKIAHKLVQEQKLKIKKPDSMELIGEYVFIDLLEDRNLQKRVINYYHQHPYTDHKKAIKDLGIKIKEHVFLGGLEELINQGYKIPCLAQDDPIAYEKLKRDIVKYKEENMYATPKVLSDRFGLKEKQIVAILYSASEEYRQEKIRSYELYFKKVLGELDEVGELCMDRFYASPQSSSRWLEIRQMGIEKKIRMLGLNAPSEIMINQNVNVQSKEEKDAIVDAYFATEEIAQKQLPRKIN